MVRYFPSAEHTITSPDNSALIKLCFFEHCAPKVPFDHTMGLIRDRDATWYHGAYEFFSRQREYDNSHERCFVGTLFKSFFKRLNFLNREVDTVAEVPTRNGSRQNRLVPLATDNFINIFRHFNYNLEHNMTCELAQYHLLFYSDAECIAFIMHTTSKPRADEQSGMFRRLLERVYLREILGNNPDGTPVVEWKSRLCEIMRNYLDHHRREATRIAGPLAVARSQVSTEGDVDGASDRHVMSRHSTYDYTSALHLLLFYRNTHSHFSDFENRERVALGGTTTGFFHYMTARFPALLITLWATAMSEGGLLGDMVEIPHLVKYDFYRKASQIRRDGTLNNDPLTQDPEAIALAERIREEARAQQAARFFVEYE